MTNALLSVRIGRKVREAADICSFELVDASGRELPAFSAGAHIDVHLRPDLVRQYSLCNAPHERHRYVIAVLRDARTRGGSRAMHDEVSAGDLICIGEPRNHFPLDPGAGPSLLLAGGIGVTPILAMAEQLAADGRDFELHYATRSRERTAFVERIGGSAYARKASFHFDDGPPGQRMDVPALLDAAAPDTHVYVCGPQGFLDLVRSTAEQKGWPPGRVHFEYFSAAPGKSGSDHAFDIRIASSGRTFRVPGGQTVIEVLAAQGVEISTSCEQGVCGTCLTRVLEGEVDHRDHFLTPEEQARNDQFLPCCSRARSGFLVLDL